MSDKIKVGIIGLNAPYDGQATGTSWAALGHLPFLTTSEKFRVAALQNSSVERARKAIHAYGLDPDQVKAYDTPEGKQTPNRTEVFHTG
jgi:predicted dehydrogenase